MTARAACATFALGLLGGAGAFALGGLVMLASDVGETLGMTSAAVAALALAQPIVCALACLPLGLARRRALTVAGAAAIAAGGTVAIAFAQTPFALAGALTLAAAGTAAALALHPPLVAAVASPARALALHTAGQCCALAAGAGIAAALLSTGDLTWRAIFLALAGLGALVAPLAALLREADCAAPASLTFAEVARGLTRMATVRRLLVGQAALGALAVPLLLFAGYMLEDRWGLGTSARGAVFAALAIAAAAVLVLLAREGERLLERGPEMVLRCAAAAAAIAAAALPAAALAPLFGLSVALLGAAFGALAVAWAAIVAVELTIVADGARQHAAVLGALAALGVGGIAGLLVSGDLVDDLGTTAALAVLCLPAAIAALALRAAADTAGDDLRATAAASAEERAVGQARGAGAREPLLACRGIVVSYGHRRALDGVDLEVREGELVALLGTNGAGKSTLLRVISGLTPPVAGTVRLEGRDITLADTERRFGLGIGHVAGGDSLFGSLRVAESLRLAAHMAGLRDAVQREAVGGVLQRFPQLADRTATRAAALSGGERQMLALAQMLLRPPRLLLIDELSLGLAPGVVDELLGVVREIHAAGTTVLLVEQSADLALGLATRAVFLERGRVRFDGDPQTLRRRDDLLRAVFLARA